METTFSFPRKYNWLWKPARYKVVHGGRWSWKSTTAARYCIIRAFQENIRIFCAREFFNSIEESVHPLLVEQIDDLGLNDYFDVKKQYIDCRNGSHIFFGGINKNSRNKKSMHGVELCWIEEADQVTEETWRDLTLTIRGKKEGKENQEQQASNAEILLTFNRKYLDDATDKRFVQNHPKNSIVREINYTDVYTDDNIPDILKDEISDCWKRDPSGTTYKQQFLNMPVGTGSKIWTTFNNEIHVLNSRHRYYTVLTMEAISKYGNCFMAMDPHSKFYPFCIWGAMLPAVGRPGNVVYVIYNEWPRVDTIGDYYSELRKKLYYDGSIRDLEKQIYASDGNGYPVDILDRFIDSRFAKGAGGQNWSTSTEGIVQEFARPENGGMLFNMPSEKVIDAQRNIIIDHFTYNNLVEFSDHNSPELYIMPHCKNVIQSLENHRCEEESEKEDEKYKDPSDALRILFAGMHKRVYINKNKTDVYEKIISIEDQLKPRMLSLAGTYQ